MSLPIPLPNQTKLKSLKITPSKDKKEEDPYRLFMKILLYIKYTIIIDVNQND